VGLLPPAARIYTDSKGRILKVVRGEMVMLASSQSEVEKVFKQEMAEADDLYKRSMEQMEKAIRKLDASEQQRLPGRPGGRLQGTRR
jgi:hypothetical protein